MFFLLMLLVLGTLLFFLVRHGHLGSPSLAAGNRSPEAEAKKILAELHYVRTLLRDVDRELGAAWNA